MSSAQKSSKDLTDTETSDPGYRSRSQSRRSRRRKQQAMSQAQTSQKQQLPALDEEETVASSQANTGAMQPFDYIGPDETSMNGPVTKARADRGEIPRRPGNPNQELKTGPKGGNEDSKMMDQDGLKLRLELNLDVEIELKASIRGDLTLALL